MSNPKGYPQYIRICIEDDEETMFWWDEDGEGFSQQDCEHATVHYDEEKDDDIDGYCELTDKPCSAKLFKLTPAPAGKERR